ncbi:arsenate reductase/protein-tyrosine-phosphatase family protein [Colwellia psychrerythraea]|uniref:Phosphotyrosine protein phosphatase I superfamily n=1 Tax=Colwellia psychrerythraea TaxID=28229 RepID=A0A099KA75_COLPS|nr:hypothetical protein [Colwellia psychrerythraea]KGJ86987.1 Phosphotyrosine protein phosphatase I superfamily [Colwellia psychrerythraea]
MNILFLCTANIQRSKTAEEIFRAANKNHQYKSAGISAKYVQKANSTLCTEELLKWADQIYVFEQQHIDRIQKHTDDAFLPKIINLHIPDDYQYFQRELVLLLLERVKLVNYEHTPIINHSVAFDLGSSLLEKWGCTTIQKLAILGVNKTDYHRFQTDPSAVSLNTEQLERLSYVARIHQSLKVTFSNPKNVYGFMSMKNNNSFFNGRTPLSIIATGNFDDFYDVFKCIDSTVIR